MYPGSTGKVSTLTHFPLEPECEDYSFLDQAVEDFKHGFGSILLDFVSTSELDASFDETDAMPSLVCTEFLHLVSTISDTSKLWFVLSIKSHQLWCQARVLLLTIKSR